MVRLPVAELRMSACFPRRGVPPVRRRSRADGIVIMICYARAHLRGAQRGEDGEVSQVNVSHLSTRTRLSANSMDLTQRTRETLRSLLGGLVRLQWLVLVSEQKIACLPPRQRKSSTRPGRFIYSWTRLQGLRENRANSTKMLA